LWGNAGGVHQVLPLILFHQNTISKILEKASTFWSDEKKYNPVPCTSRKIWQTSRLQSTEEHYAEEIYKLWNGKVPGWNDSDG
jgi:hypothetical protein